MTYKLIVVFVFVTQSLSGIAQDEVKSILTVATYPKEISCEVGFTADLPIPKATSTCKGEIHITQNDELASGGCPGTLIRTYIFVDDCGSMSEAMQFIKLKDTEPPQLFDVPKEVFLLNKEAIPAPAVVSASDNSGEAIVVSMSENEKDHIITRTWTAEDMCGNQTVSVQKIHITH